MQHGAKSTRAWRPALGTLLARCGQGGCKLRTAIECIGSLGGFNLGNASRFGCDRSALCLNTQA
jgi:hypothetical protein